MSMINSQQAANQIFNLLLVPQFFLAGVFSPIAVLPWYLEILSRLSPMRYVIAFRALLAPLVTLLPAALVLLLASPAIAGATRIGVQASSFTQFLLIVLVLGAGADYGLFLVFRVREELRNGLEPHEAVVRALTHVGETITFSACTVIAALLSLLAAQFGLYHGLGPGLAIGIALMLLAALTLLPALLAILGRAVFWPSRTRSGTGSQLGLWGRAGRQSRHLRRAGSGGGKRHIRGPGTADRRRHRGRCDPGHVPDPHGLGALDGSAAGSLELVAFNAVPA
jgi:hypothetical protein